MPHRTRLYKVVVDVAKPDHDRELGFWRSATGEPLPRFDYPEYHGSTLGNQDFAILVQRLGEGPSRVHLDIHTDDLEAEVTRLEGLGATRVQQIHGSWVMRDPAGLPFCVILDRSLTDDNSRRWD